MENIAIILLNYNNYYDTFECIKSIYANQYTALKIFLVDNCSTDDSYLQLKQLQKIYDFELLKSDKNGGFSYGNNLGIRQALKEKFDYVLLLNNDTLVENLNFEKLLLPFKLNDKIMVTTAKILYNDNKELIWYDGGKINKLFAKVTHINYRKKNNSINTSRYVDFANGCLMCIKSELFSIIGLLNEDYFLYEEDTDFCYKIKKAKKKIYYLSTTFIYHKVNSTTKKTNNDNYQYYSVRNKFLFIKQNYFILAKPIVYICAIMLCLHNIIRKKNTMKTTKIAYNDFLNGKKGKRNE